MKRGKVVRENGKGGKRRRGKRGKEEVREYGK